MMKYNSSTHRYFPLFIDSEGEQVLVVGGGTIAERRILTLLRFRFHITLLSPEVTSVLVDLSRDGKLQWICAPFDEHTVDIDRYGLVLACTDDRAVNKRVGEMARKSGIYVSECDDHKASTAWFPAVALSDDLTIGIVGTGEKHGLVKQSAAKVRRLIKGEL